MSHSAPDCGRCAACSTPANGRPIEADLCAADQERCVGVGKLPSDSKTSLWLTFRDRPGPRHTLKDHLVGDDIAWLRRTLDTNAMSPQDALDTFRDGRADENVLAALAELLVPLGVEPRHIANTKRAGFWWGDDSDRYASLVNLFERLCDHDEPSASAVGSAGVELFSTARDEALANEHEQRIRGYR